MIKYPILKDNATIGVTAPSSGVEAELHELVHSACKQLNIKGFKTVCGNTVWNQKKAKSAPKEERALEFNQMVVDDKIDIIIPPWGGELLIEMLEDVDFENMKNKWVLGYSDTSVLLLAITLKTGIATAHGTNLVDLREANLDETTAMWESVLATEMGESIVQYSSSLYQKEWQFDHPLPASVFNLTEKTIWKTVTQATVKMEGRLLGGCIDVIRHLIGTPFGDVRQFRKEYINEPIVWYFENCELKTTDLQRTLVQMRLAGWFENCSGILFGRSAANMPVEDYLIEDVYQDLFEELNIPIVYDIDCGHQPPQITFINGAYAKVHVENGKGTVIQEFKP
ncbi:LD-carboxypeptidase [Pseudogracilibacillus sp. SE30717A]|uniref:S66 family peptidase n=1 Tax=Pseudogracilibacillus sp. SE30717A TaxID=3098293 RepID=UPI00300E35D5